MTKVPTRRPAWKLPSERAPGPERQWEPRLTASRPVREGDAVEGYDAQAEAWQPCTVTEDLGGVYSVRWKDGRETEGPEPPPHRRDRKEGGSITEMQDRAVLVPRSGMRRFQ